MNISATSFAQRILDAAKESVKSLSHLKLTVIQDISYTIDNFVEKFTYDRRNIVTDLFANRKSFALNVFDFFKWRGILRRSAVYKAAALLVAVYIFATQFAGPPNYYATYDRVMPPKGNTVQLKGS